MNIAVRSLSGLFFSYDGKNFVFTTNKINTRLRLKEQNLLSSVAISASAYKTGTYWEHMY
ncbi:MAG TPA: hypothetical protein V6D12_18925 [Candidatus Obscuribacterales bacterium]